MYIYVHTSIHMFENLNAIKISIHIYMCVHRYTTSQFWQSCKKLSIHVHCCVKFAV